MKCRSLYWLAVAALVVGACSSDASNSSDPTTPLEGSTTTVVVEETSAPPTTDSVASGWTPVDTGSLSGVLAYPCCGSDWYGVPSPFLPADGAPLLDGEYHVQVTWADDPTQPLELKLLRFVPCADLPEGSCENPDDPEAIGVDVTTSVQLTLPLDADLRVALIGFGAYDTADGDAQAAIGTGLDLASLAAAVDQAYAEVFAARLADGEAPNDIIDDVMANPVAGFEAAPLSAGGGITFTFGDAPPLLFQSPFHYDTDPPTAGRGVDVLGIPSISVLDGVITLHVYAGFYS